MLSKARQTLPPDLEITKMADGTTSIMAKRDFVRGTTFGPFEAKRNWTMNPITNFPIRIFGSSPTGTYHLDYSNEETSNWMCFIAPASCAKEQNLICYQVKVNIFYTAMRQISSGEELRVWYAPFYAAKMKMPLYNVDFTALGPSHASQDLPSSSSNSKTDQIEILNKDMAQELAERLPAQKLGAKDDKASWNCKICSAIITSVPSYAKHLMEHYKSLLGAFCNLCNRKFYNNSVLQKHKAEKHPETVNEAIGIPTSENHRQQNAQMILLNMSESEGQTSDAMKDILDKFKAGKTITESSIREADKETSDLHLLDTNSINVNDLLQNSNLLENSSLKSILENQCLNINLSSIADSILSDNVSSSDPVKFNVEELASDLLEMTNDNESLSQRIDNLDCDICGKKFDKPEYLYRHLRKHTGEFICPACLAVFARKENLMCHVCLCSKKNDSFECPYCQKQFTVRKYLKRHMIKHTDMDNCKWCRKTFPSELELAGHKCPAPRHICPQCGKRFVNRAHLTRHTKLHNTPKPVAKSTKSINKKKTVEEKPLICEKCGDAFKTSYILKQHLRSHGERTFECDICQRRFHRISVLKQHKQTHGNAQIPCNICGKKLKSKKALDVHVLLHGNKKYQCDKCDKSFFQRCNYVKHFRQIHGEKTMYKCPHCPTQFTSEASYGKHVESHLRPAEHPCEFCQKSFHGQYQLKRHVQTSHSGIRYRCPYCSMTARHRHSMRRHFERQHKELCDEWSRPGFVNGLEERIDKAQQSTAVNIQSDDNNEGALMTVGGGGVFEGSGNAGQMEGGETHILPDMQVDEVDGIGDVPQLSISDADTQLAESVLGNAYIFGEDGGDIMFYVLDNGPVISEY